MRPRFPGALILMLHEKRAREKLVVFLFIEPRAFDVEELQTGHADGERERIDRQLRNWLVRARIGFVVENVHGVVSDLQKVDMAGDGARRPTRRELDAISCFKVADLVFGEPNRNLDCDGARVIREHEILQRLVPQLVVADGGNDERGGSVAVFSLRLMMRRSDVGECGLRLRGAGLRIVFAAKQFVRACGGNVFEKGCERFEALVLRIAAQKCELRAVIGEGVDLAVIQLDRADGLRRRIDCLCFGAKAAEGGLLFVRADPRCDRGWGDGAAGFGLQALGGFVERVAQIIERERLQHEADRVGLIAKRGRAGREHCACMSRSARAARSRVFSCERLCG